MATLGTAALLLACPIESNPPADSTASDTTDPPTTAATDEPSGTGSGSTGGGPEAWFEVGWGISEFNEFDGILPVVVGPQGLAMFSMPMRGAGFYTPPDPGFDNPDMPMLEAWVDIPGYSITPDGHFNEVTEYPALFYPSLESPGVLEGPAVWLVIPDQAEPEQIAGLPAHLHAEMLDANGVLLVEDHDLVVGEAPEPPPGP